MHLIGKPEKKKEKQQKQEGEGRRGGSRSRRGRRMTRTIQKEGWMVRYGRRKIGRSFFHKRYFVLESLVLAYYKRKPSDQEVRL
jgi:ribosomal protein L19E